MPYIVTILPAEATPAGGLPGDPPPTLTREGEEQVSRVAVLTLAGARRAAYARIDAALPPLEEGAAMRDRLERAGERIAASVATSRLPEEGGTVSVADGTLIVVERVDQEEVPSC